MIHHIVMWNFLDEMSLDEKRAAANKMKNLLEPIGNIIPGTKDIRIIFNELESSNREVALISTFETLDALLAYQVSDAHVEAGKYVRSVTKDRACVDYEE